MSKQAATSVATAVFLVVITATVALGLNLGLLNGVEAAAPAPQPVAPPSTEASPATEASPPSSLPFATPDTTPALGFPTTVPIDGIGTVTIEASATGVDLLETTVEPGWQALVQRGDPAEANVTFVFIEDEAISADATFHAALSNGQVQVRIGR